MLHDHINVGMTCDPGFHPLAKALERKVVGAGADQNEPLKNHANLVCVAEPSSQRGPLDHEEISEWVYQAPAERGAGDPISRLQRRRRARTSRLGEEGRAIQYPSEVRWVLRSGTAERDGYSGGGSAGSERSGNGPPQPSRLSGDGGTSVGNMTQVRSCCSHHGRRAHACARCPPEEHTIKTRMVPHRSF